MSDKAREFWIDEEGGGTANPDYQSMKPDDSIIRLFIHVIEYQAFLDLTETHVQMKRIHREELERERARNAKMRDSIRKLIEESDENEGTGE